MALVELQEKGHIAVITINRPKALNALNMAVLHELNKVLDVIEAHDDLHVVVITGEGRSFVAGADIAEMSEYNASDGKAFSSYGSNTFLRINHFPRPVIAAVNGFALGGGCELAMACDIRIASEKAKFAMPEVGLGIIPGFGGTQRLARIVGMSTAIELVLTTQTISADEALKIGLVTHVYSPEELMDKALELAELIASKPQVAVRQAKQAIRIGKQMDISSALSFESESFGLCFSTEDQKDAMRAFLKKEKPAPFKNR